MDLANIPDFGSRQLLAVLAIADYGSFIAAAAFLKTSQPALTRTIKRIEDVLDVRLFERTTRRVQLTPARRSSRRPPGRTGEGPNRGSRSRNGCRRVGARKDDPRECRVEPPQTAKPDASDGPAARRWLDSHIREQLATRFGASLPCHPA